MASNSTTATTKKRPATKKKAAEITEQVSIAADETAKQTEAVYTASQVQDMIAAAVRQALEQAGKAAPAPARERVHLLLQAPLSESNVMSFGPEGRFGRITGPTGSIYVPKDEFPQILDGLTRVFLDRRWLIVVSGLDDQERNAYGVNYREGEYLTRDAFDNLLKQGEKLLAIYPELCAGSREIVAKRVYEGWRNRNKTVNRGLVTKLNRLCKKVNPSETTFKTILEEMNAADSDGDEEE